MPENTIATPLMQNQKKTKSKTGGGWREGVRGKRGTGGGRERGIGGWGGRRGEGGEPQISAMIRSGQMGSFHLQQPKQLSSTPESLESHFFRTLFYTQTVYTHTAHNLSYSAYNSPPNACCVRGSTFLGLVVPESLGFLNPFKAPKSNPYTYFE